MNAYLPYIPLQTKIDASGKKERVRKRESERDGERREGEKRKTDPPAFSPSSVSGPHVAFKPVSSALIAMTKGGSE